MERTRTKILENSEKLKEEYEAVQLFLNNILQRNSEAVKDISNLNEKEISLKKKYFLDVVEFQYSAIHKLLEIGMDLDEFSKQTRAPSLENINSLACKTELSSASSSAYESNIPSTLCTPNEDCNKSVVSSIEVCESQNNETTPMLAEKTEETINDASSDFFTESNKDDSKKSSADISSSEEVSQKPETKKKTVQEKLKFKKLMTRRDRYLQNIQRPNIPDLSFKPSSKVLDSTESFVTCPESSSSTSAIKLKERRRKIRRRSSEKDLNVKQEVIGYKQPPEPYVNLLCLVSRIVSPSEFYINYFDENIGLIDAISHQLTEIFKETGSPFLDKETAMEKLGDHCVCYLENFETWYRVTVTNWRLKARDYQKDQVTVFLVDYGHTYNTTYKNLRELTEEFCHVPKCAIRCHLAWLYPPGSSRDNLLETWPKNSLEFFHNQFPQENECLYKVVYVEKCSNSWAIDIIKDNKKDERETFGQLLIDNEMAVEIFQDSATLFKSDFFLNQVKTAQGLAGISQNMTHDERLEKFNDNTEDYEYNNIDQAMLRYKATDEARICKNMRPDGTCFKGKRCQWEHKKLRSDGITTDKQCIYISAFNELEMPTAETTVKLQITNVINVNTFYACLMNSQSEGLRNLISKMNKRETIAKYRRLEIMPARGEIVIAKNWNNYWYRAQVKDICHFPQNPEETVQVFFVDLGEIGDTKMSDLKIMTPEFLYIPFQAIYCRLFNVKPKEDQDPQEAKTYCESHFLCQIFNADVVYASPSTLEVILRKDNSQDVGEQIIDDGFGELRTGHEFPAETLLVD